MSYRWEAPTPERFTRQVCHAYAFTGPPSIPECWTRPADGELLEFNWTSLAAPTLDREMDAAQPALLHDLASRPRSPRPRRPAHDRRHPHPRRRNLY